MNSYPTRTIRIRHLCLAGILSIFFTLTSNAWTNQQSMHQKHRAQLSTALSDGIAVLSGTPANDHSDGNCDFHQNSNFYYLTGYNEPDAAMLLIPGAEKEFVLFVKPKTPMDVLWNGKRFGIEEAMAVYGADTAFAIDQFEKVLPDYLRDHKRIFCDIGDSKFIESLLSKMKRTTGPHVIEDIRPLLSAMRVIKNEDEITCLQKAIDITCEAQKAVLKNVEPGMYEYEIEGLIEYTYRKHGTQDVAFSSIVASGPNATVLHYSINDRRTETGDLLLMDIGASYNHYAADVTRTIPISGKFTKAQKEIYAIVLEAQQAAIDIVKPGTGLTEIGQTIIDVAKERLRAIGLVSDMSSAWQMRVWQMHGTSHWLGLDVHDDGPYNFKDKTGTTLEPGMVFTIEPGIYISSNVLDNLDILFPHIPRAERDAFMDYIAPVLDKYIDIGVRIEDDVLVTDNGYVVLSSNAPKAINEIERAMQRQ